MTTYVYEIVSKKPDAEPRYVEIRQSMKDAPLTRHPETGEAIRRVILGGYGTLNSGSSESSPRPAAPSSGHGCGCGAKHRCG